MKTTIEYDGFVYTCDDNGHNSLFEDDFNKGSWWCNDNDNILSYVVYRPVQLSSLSIDALTP